MHKPRLSLILFRDCNWTRTQNHLVCKRTLNHLAELAVRSFWQNGWVFVYELSSCGFESSCSHLNFRFRASFELGVPWHSGNYRVWIHSEARTWHDKNIQSLFKMTIYLAIWFIFMDHLQNKAVAEVLDNWQCLEYVSQLLFTLHLLLFRFYP